VLAVAFALLSALCTAANLVFQHQASGEAPAGADHGWRLLRHLVVQPLWLVGLAVMAVGFVCHAVALHFGQLSLVQPLLVTELVFVLVLRRVRIGERLGRRPWIAASVTCAGLAVLLVVADPSPSSTVPTARGWVTAIVVVAVLAGGAALVARFGPRRLRATMYGASAGLVWAIDAAFVKTTTDVLAADGWWPMFVHWPVYALVGSGVVGALLLQAALHAGPLSASQPAVVTVDPLASIVLGVWLFHEGFRDTPLAVTASALAFGVMIVGVVLMARTELSKM
jgi:drug/metabolite transporter (DMT)-like permease